MARKRSRHSCSTSLRVHSVRRRSPAPISRLRSTFFNFPCVKNAIRLPHPEDQKAMHCLRFLPTRSGPLAGSPNRYVQITYLFLPALNTPQSPPSCPSGDSVKLFAPTNGMDLRNNSPASVHSRPFDHHTNPPAIKAGQQPRAQHPSQPPPPSIARVFTFGHATTAAADAELASRQPTQLPSLNRSQFCHRSSGALAKYICESSGPVPAASSASTC